jgi:hypothetical protein
MNKLVGLAVVALALSSFAAAPSFAGGTDCAVIIKQHEAAVDLVTHEFEVEVENGFEAAASAYLRGDLLAVGSPELVKAKMHLDALTRDAKKSGCLVS